MPTTYVWNSTTSNMATSTAYTPSGTPATGDTLIFPENATVAPASNMDTHAAVVFAKLHIAPGCRIDIGAAGNPLETAATLLEHFGLGTLYYENQTNGDHAIYLASPNTDAAIVIASGTNGYPNVNIGRGHFRFGASGAGITRARVTSTGAVSRDAKLTVTTAVDYVAYLIQEAGECNISVPVPYLTVTGGRYTQTVGAIADARIAGGYVMMGPSGGSISQNCELTGGTLDLNTYPLARTMGKIVKYKNARYLYQDGLTTHTLVDLQQKFGVN